MIETIILLTFLASIWLATRFKSELLQAEFIPPFGDFRKATRDNSNQQSRWVKFLVCLSIAIYVVYELFVITADSLGSVFIGG